MTAAERFVAFYWHVCTRQRSFSAINIAALCLMAGRPDKRTGPVELSHLLRVPYNTAWNLLGRLERAGLVEDGALTQEGQAAIAALEGDVDDERRPHDLY
jgi:hypothetical protein